MTAVFIRQRKRTARNEHDFIPDSWFEQFGHDTAIVHSDRPGRYDVTTFADLGRKKRQRQAERLRWKREGTGHVHRRAIYVWVFYCPGAFGFAYRGWWTYLVGRDWDSGKYLSRDEATIRQLMEMFPMGEPTLFGATLSHWDWMPLFARRYCCRKPNGRLRRHGGRVQGKALLWAEFDGDNFLRIIGRAYLPKTTGGS